VLARIESTQPPLDEAAELNHFPPGINSPRLFPARTGVARTVQVLHGRPVPAFFHIDHSPI